MRWLLFYPLLIVGGCHMLLTGSPIPLWHIETLDAPVLVSAATEDHLVLQDGRTITLPFIKTIPHDNPLFKTAIANGIEITGDGEAFVLMWSDRSCGNDPVVWRRLRVNLSNLAGALEPDSIEAAALHPESLSHLKKHNQIEKDLRRNSGHLRTWDWVKMRRVRLDIDEWAEQNKNGAAEKIRPRDF